MKEKTESFRPDEIFRMYTDAKDYTIGLNLRGNAQRNIDFYNGKQWEGKRDMPEPVINIIKRYTDMINASINSNPISVKIVPSQAPFHVVTPEKYDEYATKHLSEYHKFLKNETEKSDLVASGNPIYKMESEAKKCMRVINSEYKRLKMASIKYKGFKNAILTNDFILYTYWDPKTDNGNQAVMGAPAVREIENFRFFLGDPEESDVQKQSYIIVEAEERVRDLKREAKDNNLPEAEINNITSGTAESKTYTENEHNEKATVLYFFFKDPKSGNITMYKSTESVIIFKKETELKRFPFARLSVGITKGYGTSIISSVIHNQKYINTIISLVELCAIKAAFPKIMYNKQFIKVWDNTVAGAIAVDGPIDMGSMVSVLHGADLPAFVLDSVRFVIEQTQSSLGLNDVLMGNYKPDNKSAILVAYQAAQLPNEELNEAMRSFIEDWVYCYLDICRAYMKTPRWVKVEDEEGNVMYDSFSAGDIQSPMNVNVHIGVSNIYSEAAAASTLDNLFASNNVDLETYNRLLPESYKVPGLAAELEKIAKLKREAAKIQKEKQENSAAPAPSNPGAGSTNGKEAAAVSGLNEVVQKLGGISGDIPLEGMPGEGKYA